MTKQELLDAAAAGDEVRVQDPPKPAVLQAEPGPPPYALTLRTPDGAAARRVTPEEAETAGEDLAREPGRPATRRENALAAKTRLDSAAKHVMAGNIPLALKAVNSAHDVILRMDTEDIDARRAIIRERNRRQMNRD